MEGSAHRQTMLEILPPTSHLPPIKRISSQDIDSLIASVLYLRTVYNPEVRGSRRRKPIRSPAIGTTGATALTPERCRSEIIDKELILKQLRMDTFERAYAIKWLTALISRLGTTGGDIAPNVESKMEKIIQEAASLLAVCAGAASAGTVTRELTFPYRPRLGGYGEPMPITVKLTDISLDNQDYGSVGAQTWGGACVLSEMIVENPSLFGLDADQLGARGSEDAFRILELGSGTGLVSLVVGKLLREVGVGIGGTRRVEIVATDYYPSVMENLRANIEANTAGSAGSSVVHLVQGLDWSRFGVENARNPPFDKPFDLVLGADIIYEAEHAAWIRSCLVHLLRKPSLSRRRTIPDPLFHLVIPLRQTHRFESSTIETIFRAGDNFPHSLSLRVESNDIIICDVETGEEVEYAYYKIGWG